IAGSAAVLAPILLVGLAVILMRTEPHPEIRPRLVLGGLLVIAPALGIWHLAAGSPTDARGRADAAGILGYAGGGPLGQGRPPWLALPILLLAMVFGVLLLTGTTVREAPARLREYFGLGDHADDPYDPADYDADGFPVHRPRTRRRGRTPDDNYPPDEFGG